ncbi:MAG: hypothetical protein ACMUHY_07840 [Thermoplasmatota archaeon]
MNIRSIVLLTALSILIAPFFTMVVSSEGGSDGPIPRTSEETPTRGTGTRTNVMISPSITGQIASTDNISSEGGIAFTFEDNSLEPFVSLPSSELTTQDQNNGRSIVVSGPFTFVSHILTGGPGSYISFWLSRYDSRLDRWDQSIEVHNVTGYVSAACELAAAGEQLFYGIYLVSSEGSGSGVYVKQADLHDWVSIINAVPYRIDTNGHVSGGEIIQAGSDILVFWKDDNTDEVYMSAYRDLTWSNPSRIVSAFRYCQS